MYSTNTMYPPPPGPGRSYGGNTREPDVLLGIAGRGVVTYTILRKLLLGGSGGGSRAWQPRVETPWNLQSYGDLVSVDTQEEGNSSTSLPVVKRPIIVCHNPVVQLICNIKGSWHQHSFLKT